MGSPHAIHPSSWDPCSTGQLLVCSKSSGFSPFTLTALLGWGMRPCDSCSSHPERLPRHPQALEEPAPCVRDYGFDPFHSAAAGATLLALQSSKDPETAQTFPTAAEEDPDAVGPGGDQAGQVRVGQGELSLGH